MGAPAEDGTYIQVPDPSEVPLRFLRSNWSNASTQKALSAETSTAAPGSSRSSSLSSSLQNRQEGGDPSIVDGSADVHQEKKPMTVHSGCEAQTPQGLTPEDVLANSYTSLMITNLPPQVTQDKLREILADTGFGNAYNFLYAPRIFKSGAGRGYAFINFYNCDLAAMFVPRWTGLVFWQNQRQPLSVVKADCQGLQELTAVCLKHKMHRVKNPSFRPYLAGPWEVRVTV
mmetsp:Transcript_34242/g.78055  ORF Transcript_34242/g.78055 Transcript_34242/m.78055 type:complete len:230 (+) Transcript_34242:140-829(+)